MVWLGGVIRRYWREGLIVSDLHSASATSDTTEQPSLRWYILKVAFNREDTIRDALAKRIALSPLKDLFGEILVPTEDVVEFTRAGKRRVVKRKLYPVI